MWCPNFASAIYLASRAVPVSDEWHDSILLAYTYNFNNLCFRVENETTLISAKNRVDLSSISEVRSYITEWPRFFGPPCMYQYAIGQVYRKVKFTLQENVVHRQATRFDAKHSKYWNNCVHFLVRNRRTHLTVADQTATSYNRNRNATVIVSFRQRTSLLKTVSHIV